MVLGNLNTYIMSYLRVRLGNDHYSYDDFIFVSQGKAFVGALFGPLGGFVAAKIGLRPCLSLGSVIYRSHQIKLT